MRLLLRGVTGEFSFTKDYVGDDTIPPYAILSHTWEEGQEVTFQELMEGTGQGKTGYNKIRFCAQQAEHDGLHFFWVDTCCINKTDQVELQDAINSMYRWYQSAVKCYVFLSDVSTAQGKVNGEYPMLNWEPAFRVSRWFTRGWTLQELLAPSCIEFFSREGKLLGNKRSLEKELHEITNIAIPALRGTPPCNFDVEERLSWIKDRRTTRKEDKAYSLLGIFGIYMLPNYGEGEDNAFKRLRKKIGKIRGHRQQQSSDQTSKEYRDCIRQLRLTDPRDDKKRIEDTKGGLLEDSYRWIMENAQFQRWYLDPQSRLLWIKGDPGKGKTMLLCGIINELERSMAKTHLLSYFFCQATDSRINSATAVLRGLVYLLVDQQPSLFSHIQKKHDHAGKMLFEDTNAWVALSEIFIDILEDPGLHNTFLIVDALDECIDSPKLLDLIVKKSSVSSRVKWIVSSRNWPDIEERLEQAAYKVRLSLELNTESISTAVHAFIERKVFQLAQRKKYDNGTRDAVLKHLVLNANDTFLWVALVCQSLEQIPRWNVLKKLNMFPPSLDSFYERMMQQIGTSDDACLYTQILSLVAVVYRPITIEELASLAERLEHMADDIESIRDIIGLCGSFLTLRGKTIYFVHQSAKDYLLAKASNIIMPSGLKEIHYDIFSRSFQTMSRTLQRDMYNLKALGFPIERVKQPDPDPLVASRYSCIYWIDHLWDCYRTSYTKHKVDLQDGGNVDTFIRENYLYWLEALSLCKSVAKGITSIAKLEAMVQDGGNSPALTELVQDARRFLMSYKWAIENSPLQTYASALVFSPIQSPIRDLYEKEMPTWITIKPKIEDKWRPCLQTLECHSSTVNSVAFSHESARLASASGDRTVRLWDTSSGECVQTLNGHRNAVYLVVFSHDSARLASTSSDMTVKVWDAKSGECLRTLNGHSSTVWSVAFSYDSTWLASASDDHTVRLWDANSGECLKTLKGHGDRVYSVVFSHNSARLASGSSDRTVKLWNASSGECLQTLKGHSRTVNSVAFSHNSAQLASASSDRTVKIWDASSGECLRTLDNCHSSTVNLVVFSHNSARLASASSDRTVKLWDVGSGECLQKLEGHSSWVWSVAFSHDSTWLASASGDHTVKLWDARSGISLQTPKGHSDRVSSMVFSHDSAQFASVSSDKTVKLWDASSGECLQTFNGHSSVVNSVAFSHDSAWLASASEDHTARLWDASSGECLQILKGHGGQVYSVAFSHDSVRLVSASSDRTVKLWDASSGNCLQTLNSHSSTVWSVAFSYNSAQLASGSSDRTVKLWDAGSGECLKTLKGHSDRVYSVAFSRDSARLASSSSDKTVKIWDASSGECLQIFSIGKPLFHISFDTSGSFLHTNIGTIKIADPLDLSSPLPSSPELQIPQYQGLAISTDGVWLTYNSDHLLWLPSEYRPSCSAVSRDAIGIGVGTGRVWICKVEL